MLVAHYNLLFIYSVEHGPVHVFGVVFSPDVDLHVLVLPEGFLADRTISYVLPLLMLLGSKIIKLY